MKAIIVDEKEFEDIFKAVEQKYTYDHKFMRPTETVPEFEQTERYQMLQTFRSTILMLKRDLTNA